MFKPKQIENVSLFLYVLSPENMSIIIKNDLEKLVQIKKGALLGQLYEFDGEQGLIVYAFLSNYNADLEGLAEQ